MAVCNMKIKMRAIKIWAFFVEDKENNDIRVNLRSSGAAVNEVAVIIKLLNEFVEDGEISPLQRR